MNIFFWDVESQNLATFINQLEGLVTLSAISSLEELNDAIEDIAVVLLDLDFDKKAVEKLVKKIRKNFPDVKIMYLYDSLSSKELIKHQKSKIGGDFYFKLPVELELFNLVVEDVFGESISLNEHAIKQEFITDQDHYKDSQLNYTEKKFVDEIIQSYSLTTQDQQSLDAINDKIQEQFDIVFSTQDEATSKLLQLDELEKEENELGDKFDFDDLSIDEITDSGEFDLSEEDDEYEEYEYDDEEQSQELNLSDRDLGLEIDEIDILENEEENLDGVLDLTGDELDLTNLNSENEIDLSLAESTEDGVEISLSDKIEGDLELTLDEQEIELSIENQMESNKEDKAMSNDKDLDLEVAEDLVIDDTSSESLSLSELDDDIDLGTDETPALELSSSDDQENNEDLENNAFGEIELADDNKLEIPKDSNDLVEDVPPIEDELSIEIQEHVEEQQGIREENGEDPIIYEGSASEIVEEEPIDESGLDEIEQSESVMAKLAEIDAMMDEEVLSDDDLFGQPEVQTSEDSSNCDENAEQKLSQTVKDYNEISQVHSSELETLGETIKTLRQDREELIQKVYELEQNQGSEKQVVLDLRSQLDEKRIELVVIKKRLEKKIDDLQIDLSISLEKKEIVELKNIELEKEIESLTQKMRKGFGNNRSREKELENKLELLRNDASVQIKNRDHIILELRRKVDSLEFDLETLQSREKKSLVSKHQQEDKLVKAIEKLKNAIGELEQDTNSASILEDLKKNLDV